MPWEETTDFIRSGHKDSSDFQADSFRTITIDADQGIKAVIGKPKGSDTTQVQSYLFDKTKWMLDKAKAWFQEHATQEVRVALGLLQESFQWVSRLESLPKANRIKIVALNAGQTGNLNDYARDRLLKAVNTIIDQPLYYGTTHDPSGKRQVGVIEYADFENGALETIGLVEPEIYQLIQAGEIPHASIEARYKRGDAINGIRPDFLQFEGLLLLPKGIEPGDPQTSVHTFERLTEILSQTPRPQGRGGEQHMPEDTGPPTAPSNPPPGQVLGEQPGGTVKEVHGKQATETCRICGSLGEAEWDTAYINDLPDSAFAYIEPGGSKDDQGKTVPRTLRHLPYKNAQGNVDVEHLRNAMGRLPQTDIPEAARKEALKHLCAAARSQDLDFPSCQTLELQGQVKTLSEQVANLVAQLQQLTPEALTPKIVEILKPKPTGEKPLGKGLMTEVKTTGEVRKFSELGLRDILEAETR